MTETCYEQEKITVIAKPTHGCNLGCKYCYVSPEAEKGVMSEQTLENMIDKVVSLHQSVNFIWHGGEPLTMPLSFYRRAVELQKKHEGKKIDNGFQTNGTLVTDEVLDFCVENDFHLGFSLDGPKELHDLTRPFRNRESSFYQTLEAVKKAEERTIGEGKRKRSIGGGIIIVLNRLNLNRLPEIYEFAKRENISIQLNPLIKAGRATGCYQELGIGPEEYGQELIKLFDVWFTDGSKIRIDPFDDLIRAAITEEPRECSFTGRCQYNFISIGPQGDIYPCGRFDGLPNFRFGNINADDLVKVLTSAKRVHLQGRASRMSECQPCEYNKICNSGCMHNAYSVTGTIDSKDYYCSSYKMLFSHIGEKVKQELAKAEVSETLSVSGTSS